MVKRILPSLVAIAFLIGSLEVSGQVNRSARELAIENVQAYLSNKLFKSAIISPRYGPLKPWPQRNATIAWTIENQFDVWENNNNYEHQEKEKVSYRFSFYLNKKMEIIRAEKIKQVVKQNFQ